MIWFPYANAPPLVDIDQTLIDGYVIRLPFPMARRIENDSLVFWHTPRRLTLWISAFTTSKPADVLAVWSEGRSVDAYDERVEHEGELLRTGYRLAEDGSDAVQPSFHGRVTFCGDEFLMAAHFDLPELITDVSETWRSIRPGPG